MLSELSEADIPFDRLFSVQNMIITGIAVLVLVLVFCFLSVCAAALRESSLAVLKGSSEGEDTRNNKAAEIKSSSDKYLRRCYSGMALNSAAAVLLSGCVFILPLSFAFYSAGCTGTVSMILSLILLLFLQALVIAVCGFVIPEHIVSADPEKYLIKAAPLFRLLSVIFIPISALCGAAAILLSRFSAKEHENEEQTENPTEEKILMIADEGEENGTIEENTRSMIENVFDFDDTTVGEVMTHRKDIVGVRDGDSLSKLVSVAIESGRSRIPVYHDDIDDITGIIYVKDLLKYVGKTAPDDKIDPAIIREAVYVPDSKRCSEMFEYMTSHKTQIAVVIDEFGGTGGIITMEDLIESILGNIQDEYDNEDDVIKKVNEYSFTVDGATPLDEIEDLTGISFDEDDNDTIAGIMLDRMGHIPKNGEHPSIMINGTRFTVLEADQRRISRVLIVKNHHTEKS